MKTIENVTIYKCDFCKKELKRKHAMVKHETECFNNPLNFRPCQTCRYLEKQNDGDTEIHFISGGEDDIRYEKTPDYFFCKKKNIRVYSPKAEFKGIVEQYPETFEDQEPMPKQCDDYNDNYEF